MTAICFLIKPSSSTCNLSCRYCFYSDVSDRREVKSYGQMSYETAGILIRKALSPNHESCVFAFQGGEPTLRGLDFFRYFVKIVSENNQNHIAVQYSLQTNGILIDQKWAEFLHENHFLVGLSLDGPSDIHNLMRTDHSGNGSFDKVMRAAQILSDNHVEYNILSVVTSNSARHPRILYNFYKQHGFAYLQFIPCLAPLGNTQESAHALTDKRYGIFLCGLFDEWYKDFVSGNYISIRTFDNYISILAGKPAEQCSMTGKCSCQYVVEADGSVYPCDFYVTDEWCIGNILNDSLDKMVNSSPAVRFINNSLNRDSCSGCQWISICRGGCRRDCEPVKNGKMDKNNFCNSYKMFFDHCYGRMLEISRDVR